MSRIFSADDSVNPREGESRWQHQPINYRTIFSEHLQGKVNYAAFITGLRPIEIVSSLPSLPDTTYPEGSVVFLSTDGKLYRNVADTWTRTTPASDITGTITSAQGGVEIVSALPGLPDADYPEGAVVFLTTDDKLYRSTGSAWTVATDGADITAATIAGNKLIANTITAGQIAAGTITATEIAAGTITATEIATGTITANELAANSVNTDELVAGAVTAAKISVSQLDAVAAAMGTLTSGIIQNAASSPTKAIVFSGTVPGTADSFIDFTVGTGAGEVFMQVNNERLRIFGDGSLTTHGILKGYALHTESGEGGPGGAAYLTGATVLGNNAYLQSHQQGSTTILGSDDDDMLEIDSGDFFLRGKAATWGLSLMAILGDYSVSTAGFTQVTDTWASGDDPDGTADGKNILTLSENGTSTVTAGNRLAIPIALAGTPAYDGNYTLKFKIHHDCTNYTEPSLPVPDGDSLVSTVTIEANVNAAGYSDVGSAVFGSLVDGTTAELEFTKTVDIGNTSPTSVSFRLKLSTTMQIDPDNLSGNIVTHVRVYTTTGIGTDPYDVSWYKTTGSVQNRRGVQFFGVDAGATVVPMFNMDKESFSTTPADGDGVEGDVIYVSGAVKRLKYHDGSAWNTLETFGGNADTVDSLHAAAFVYVDGTNPLTANWDAGSFYIQATRFISDVVTGTAPLTVASTTLVANLNADLLDSQEGSYYRNAGNLNAGTLLNARVAQSNVTQHEAALTILESQITDGSVLARVAGTETISGAWTFSTQPTLDYGDTLSSKVAGYTIQSGAPAAEDYPEGTLWLDTSAVTPYDLGDLGDVTITAAAAGELLMHNGSAWVDTTALTGAYSISRASEHLTLTWTGSGVGRWLFMKSDGTHADFTANDGVAFYLAAGRRWVVVPYVAGAGQWSYEFFIDLDDLVWTFDASIRVGTNIYMGGSTTDYIKRNGNYFRHQNAYGYIDIGPNNASWGHFATGNARFHFNKEITLGAHILSGYNSDLQLRRLYTDTVSGIYLTTTGLQIGLGPSGGSPMIYPRSGYALLFGEDNATEVFRIQTNKNLYHKTGFRADNLDKGSTSASFSVDPRNGVKQYITLTNTTTITMSWTASSVEAGALVVLTIRRSSGSGSLTWPADIDWGTAGSPSVPTTAGEALTVVLYAHTASEWMGAEFGQGGYTLADF